MKKVFAFILVLCMVLSCVPTFAEGDCAHENTHWDTTETQHAKICDDCGESVVSQTAHTFTVNNGVFTCECGYTFTCDHVWSGTYMIGAQKTADEYHYQECTKTYCGVKCDAKGKVGLHNDATKLVYEAKGIYTGTTNYYHEATCKDCKQKVWNLKTSHDADCEDCTSNDGDKKCDLCGQLMAVDCTAKHTTQGTAVNVDYVNVYNAEKKCHDQKCLTCGKVFGQGDCEYTKWTCNYDGTDSATCKWCGHEVNEACAATFNRACTSQEGKAGVYHYVSCGRVAKNWYLVSCTLKAGSANCYTNGVCSVCDAEMPNTKTEHHYVATKVDADTHSYKCDNEGCIATKAAAAHTWEENADNDNHKCKECGATADHSWKVDDHSGVKTHIEKCVCGATKSVNHTWVKGADGKYSCKVCDKVNACGDKHTAKFVPGTAATCTGDGYNDYWVCDVCGYEIVAKTTIKATNHANATVTVLQEATCYHDGLKLVNCPDCNMNETVKIDSETAHNYVKTGCFADETGVTAACTGDNAKHCEVATCTEKGLDHYVCSICGKATHKESKALGHDMSKTVYSNDADGNNIKDVDCTKAVYSFTQCSRCSVLSTEYKVVSEGKEAHQLTKTKKITATCTTEGGTWSYCENVGCTEGKWVGEHGKIGDDNAHADIKDCTKVVVKTATCTTDGEYYYICKDCSVHLDKDGKELAAGKNAIEKAAGHTNEEDPTCCERKTQEEHEKLNAGWIYVAATCKTNGYFESTCENCDGNYRKVSFADSKDHDCDVCKADASKHNWVMGAIKTEAVCGKEDGTAQTICSVCKTVAKHTASNCLCETISNAITHSEQYGVHAEESEYVGKDVLWKISKDHDCQVTNDTYKKPTCAEVGYGYKTCSRCGEKTWFDEIGKTTCENSKIIKVYVPATCEEHAYNKFICSVCGAEREDREVFEVGKDGYEAATGHDYYRMGTAKLCEYGTVAKFGCKNCDYVEYQLLDGKAGVDSELSHASVTDKFSNKAYEVAPSKTAYIDKFVWVAGVNCTEDGYYLFGACPECDFVGANAEVIQTPAFHLEEKAQLDKDGNAKHTTANCVDPEYKYYECTECGEEWKVAVTDSAKVTNPKAGTVNNAGVVTDKGDHKDWTVVKYIVKETCTEDGKGVYGCPYCGVTAKDEDGKDKVETVKAGHTWSKDLIVDKAATCGDDGKGHKICTVCGEETAIASETIKANGKHAFATTVVKSNNCKEPGYIVYECAVCHKAASNDELQAAGYKQYLTSTGITTTKNTYKFDDAGELTVTTTTVPVANIVEVLGVANDHVFGASEIREATCELDGGLRHTCTICGFEEVIGATKADALGHDVVCTVTPANCYVEGEEVYSCVRCGKILSTQTLPALKHVGIDENFDKSLSVASTCATRGYNVYVCKNDGCGYTKKVMKPVNPANHKYVIDTTIREATCTVNGLAFAHCEYCYWEGLYSIAANHEWEVTGVKLAPTCTSTGVNNVECSVCGATSTQTTKALGHTMVTEVVEADCTHTAGIKTYCSVCSYMTKFIKTGSEKLGHAWGAKVFVNAACEKAAHYESTCARCSEVAVTEIAESEPYYKAALNHKGKKLIEKFDGNCMEKAYELYCCPICGENVKEEAETIDNNAHVWEITFTYGTKEVNCGNYGYVDAKCKICGDTVKMKDLKPEHSWTENIITDDIVYKVCTVCGKMDIIWNASNFTGYKGCMTWNGTAWVGQHKGLVVKASKDATCTEAGELGHIECTVCGTVIRVGGVIPAHTTKEVAAVEATCTTEGSTAGTFCLVCNKYVVAPQKIAAKGHKWVEVPAQDATATKPGFTAGTQCENCKEWKEGHEEIPVKAASLKRTAVLRKTAELLGERVALLNTDDAITITGELVNGFYPVSTADGIGYIHNSYIAVA